MKIYDIPCPECGAERKTNCKSYASLCRKNYKKCKACTLKDMSVKFSGENNPFYGKRHPEGKMKEVMAGIDQSFRHTESYRAIMSKCTSGKNNPMAGRRFYDVWVERYGKEEAEIRLVDFKAKRSRSTVGKNNPMFGKPSPKKSGSGWKGWYKGWFFRSLRELSFMVNVIEANSIGWECGEQKKYAVSYIIDGRERNYFPDFILDTVRVVEIKPEKLFNSRINTVKRDAAVIQYNSVGMTYEMIDVSALLTVEELRTMLESGSLIFDDKTLERYNKYEAV